MVNDNNGRMLSVGDIVKIVYPDSSYDYKLILHECQISNLAMADDGYVVTKVGQSYRSSPVYNRFLLDIWGIVPFYAENTERNLIEKAKSEVEHMWHYDPPAQHISLIRDLKR